MQRLSSVLIALLVSFNLPAYAVEHSVLVYDMEELAQAIRDANGRAASDHTTIGIGGGEWVTVPSDTELPAITSHVTLSGVLHGEDDTGPKRLLKIGKTGVVELRVRIIDFVINSDEVSGFIENEGQLQVSGDFKLVRAYGWCSKFGCFSVDTPVVFNAGSGKLHVEKTVFDEEGFSQFTSSPRTVFLENLGSATLREVQIYLPNRNWQTPITNRGYLLLQNVSMVNQPGQREEQRHPAVATAETASTESVNSVYSGFSGDWCDTATSLGYNISDSPECSWDEDGDLTGTSAGLVWRDSYQITHVLPAGREALVPTRISAAVDSANGEWCPARAIEDGNGDSIVQCDRGAIELRPLGLAELDGGINGLYYDPEADGHYIQVLQTDYTTLVVWNTFDQEGNHVWVYGTGELVDGSSLVAQTYINVNGGVLANGKFSPSEAVYWGTIELDMTTCADGAVAYSSDYPGFGDGSFSIKRLGFVKQLGCVD
jgi:hypothetical protein